MTNQEIAKLINTKWVHQIRAGEKHRFVDVSLIEAEGRFFVRQYKFGTKSWRDAFLNDSNGAMKLGDHVIAIDGVVPADLDEINPKINKGYFKKMNIVYWLMRLTYDRKKHEASTLELIPKK